MCTRGTTRSARFAMVGRFLFAAGRATTGILNGDMHAPAGGVRCRVLPESGHRAANRGATRALRSTLVRFNND